LTKKIRKSSLKVNSLLVETIVWKYTLQIVLILEDANLALSDASPEIKILNIKDKVIKKVGQLIGHTSNVLGLIQLSDDELASCSVDRSIKIWNFKTGRLLKNLTGHTNTIFNLALLLKNRREILISCSGDKTIKVWNQTNGKLLKTLRGHKGKVYCVCSLPNGNLASGSLDETIRIWNLKTDENIITIKKPYDNSYSVFFLLLPESGHFASGETDSLIKIFNGTTGFLANSLIGHTDQITFLINLSARHLASSSDDRTVRVWDLLNGTCLETLRDHSNTVRSLALLKNGNLLSASLDRTLKIWNLTGVLTKTIKKLEYCKFTMKII
jgi:WD40 repeat protein